MNDFRRAVELKYRLMPYVYTQAADCSANGLPMLRALFVKYPNDPASWLVEDEYMFGSDLLGAPLYESGTSGHKVSFPPGTWIDYQIGSEYEGEKWFDIQTRNTHGAREGTAIPHIGLAQSTEDMDWSKLELVVYGNPNKVSGLLRLPDSNTIHTLNVEQSGGSYSLVGNPPREAIVTVRKFGN